MRQRFTWPYLRYLTATPALSVLARRRVSPEDVQKAEERYNKSKLVGVTLRGVFVFRVCSCWRSAGRTAAGSV